MVVKMAMKKSARTVRKMHKFKMLRFDDDRYSQMARWCREFIDQGEWGYYNNIFYFYNSQNLMMFKLRWA
jgi:hypothetical protein